MKHPDNRPAHIDSSPFKLDDYDLEKVRGELARLPEVDEERMCLDRMHRVQVELQKRDIGGMLLYDPVNVRYATGCRNMQVWAMRNSSRYCLVPAEGKAVIFDFINCEHMSENLPTVAEARPAKMWLFHAAGSRREEIISAWAEELADAIKERCPNNRIVTDRLDGDPRRVLETHQINLSFGQDLIEYARCIKTPDELKAQKRSAHVCQTALRLMRQATRPGVTENEIWAILVGVNVALGGDYTESRMVVSGPRTNPWYTEASDRRIQAGELLGIDTDMIGPDGYSCDMSRTWLCKPAKPTVTQKELYSLANEQVHANMALLKPGLGFRELAERSWRIPAKYEEFEVGCIVHGIGMCNEYPQIAPLKCFDDIGYDGIFEENMTVSVESYIGERGGHEGVKLEEMVRITDGGCELVGVFPFEEELLN
jgi:Xaa-Pro aminopeptidase